MTNTLVRILDHIGFSARPQQLKLYEHLRAADTTGIVAQAGTGTGKSLAVLAAAYDLRVQSDLPTIVVTPTNILMDQYLNTDAPRVSEALGIVIKSLKGRNRYLCESAPGFSGVGRLPEHIIAAEVLMNEELAGDGIFEPTDTYWFGCPGSDECDRDGICHYRRAKAALEGADIIVTNAHLMIINDQLLNRGPVERKVRCLGCNGTGEYENGLMCEECGSLGGETVEFQPRIFPPHGAVFVDEAHTLEENLRSFATRSIPARTVEGYALEHWLLQQQRTHRDAVTVDVDRQLVANLKEIAARRDDDPDNRLKKHQKEAIEAANFILQRGAAQAYAEGEAVLWFDPAKVPGTQPKLTSTQINLAGGARRILTAQPFGLVSGTVPRSMQAALGIPEAPFVDVGHPFDYGKQAELRISSLSGSFQAAKNATVVRDRVNELFHAVQEHEGGALLLFSSYRDLNAVYDEIGKELQRDGLLVLRQASDSDKQALGAAFKADGNAVLFATESFATGFDVPGPALRLVCIWKLPYPGLDPVTRAIQARNRQRYEDAMLMKVTQAAGRLIRTTDDTGTVLILDSRAENKLLGSDDPMIRHFDDYKRQARTRRPWDD